MYVELRITRIIGVDEVIIDVMRDKVLHERRKVDDFSDATDIIAHYWDEIVDSTGRQDWGGLD
jgi:hypothetical protein